MNESQGIIKKLTIGLFYTYKTIEKNIDYFDSSNFINIQNEQKTDQNGDYIIEIGEKCHNRFEINELIGKGSFGQVVKAFDFINQRNTAIKIIKNKPAFYNQSFMEIELLERISIHDDNDSNHIVKFYSKFIHKHHLFIVFELLSITLYELLQNTNFRGVSLNLTKKFGHQLLLALKFLSSPEINIIHCDLKPENVMLINQQKCYIKLADFGSSCYADQKMYKYIQTRFYRSPEVIFELDYSFPIDIWSLGCLLFEMHTGEPTFNGNDEIEQVKKMIQTLGRLPSQIIQSEKAVVMFTNFASVLHSPKENLEYTDLITMCDKIGCSTGGPKRTRINDPNHTKIAYHTFIDLLMKMLNYDPVTRINPHEALIHPFISGNFDDKYNFDNFQCQGRIQRF